MIGSGLGFLGLTTGFIVLRDSLNGRIEHIPLTILTAIFIIVGFQLLMMGIMGDFVADLHRQMLREIYRKR